MPIFCSCSTSSALVVVTSGKIRLLPHLESMLLCQILSLNGYFVFHYNFKARVFVSLNSAEEIASIVCLPRDVCNHRVER